MDWSVALPLARASVDRAADRRRDPGLDAAVRAVGRVVVVRDGRFRVADDGARVRVVLDGPAALPAPEEQTLVVFLGQEPGPGGEEVPYVAVVRPEAPADDDPDAAHADDAVAGTPSDGTPSDGTRWATLREVGAALSDRDAGLAVTAVALAGWHARHPRCSLCGAATAPAEWGWTRRCPEDGSDHYPRTDPAVIMAVTDPDDRLLLAHAPHWPARRFSTLAGFVEPGESLESAVRREVAEEAGLRVGAVEYRGSQPWPFPASLMLAFVARAEAGDVVVDGEEVTEARWFTRAELAAATADGSVGLPPRTSVARALIEEWFGGALPDAAGWA